MIKGRAYGLYLRYNKALYQADARSDNSHQQRDHAAAADDVKDVKPSRKRLLHSHYLYVVFFLPYHTPVCVSVNAVGGKEC